MRLNWRRGALSVRSGRAIQPELLECAGAESADRNLRDIARINRWLGGHRALLRILRDLVGSDENDAGSATINLNRLPGSTGVSGSVVLVAMVFQAVAPGHDHGPSVESERAGSAGIDRGIGNSVDDHLGEVRRG